MGGDSGSGARIGVKGGGFSIRMASEADLPAVAAIESVSFADPWSGDSFRSALELPHMRFLVAESSEGSAARLLGYVIALAVVGQAEVADIAVDPTHRCGGVGGALLDRIMADLAREGVSELYLEVRESNRGARRLYESRGFDLVGRRKGYYRTPPEDAMVLRRDLGPP